MFGSFLYNFVIIDKIYSKNIGIITKVCCILVCGTESINIIPYCTLQLTAPFTKLNVHQQGKEVTKSKNLKFISDIES